MPPEPRARAADGEAGYASERYARALAHVGRPRPLPASGAWLIERETGHRSWRDAMGCYPLLVCRDWSALPDELGRCDDLVSVVAVADPVGDHDERLLKTAFPDMVRPFKEHFVCELGDGPAGTRHHRYYARRALRVLEVEEAQDPLRHLDEWTGLYAALVERHGLRGLHAFPRDSFELQLGVGGATLLRAVDGDTAVAAQIWFLHHGVAYSHLAAASPRGYELSAPYALHAAAAALLRDRAETLLLGAGAGVRGDSRDGLTAFKAGWSTGTRTAHLVGRVLDRERYNTLSAAHAPAATTDHFPAYRAPADEPAS